MELESDLGAIQNEELLRKMWQQSEDSERKKQIRSHLYKVRESRLRNLYQHDPTMSDNNANKNNNTLAGYGKDPLATSHGDALIDQSFQSLKSKEVRDSMSPTHDMKFHSLSLNQPSTTGWDVQTSSEVSPDGRAYRTETLAKTDGVEKLNGGGLAEFKGRNEQRSSASHQGDDQNYVKRASESSNTHLQEKVVFGDEQSGRTETKMSSTTSSSTSKVISSSSTVEYDEGGAEPPRYLLDSRQEQQRLHEEQQQQQQRQEQLRQEQLRQERQVRQQQHEERQQHHEERYSEARRESREQSNTTNNVETQQRYEENKHYVDMDKASPEYQRHVQHLMQQPGEIISNTVEYPKPNVKMITTVKRLPDGTIVKNKRYETEELRPASSPTKSSSNRESEQQVPRSEQRDVVDNAETLRHQTLQQQQTAESQSFSSVKKSSRRFSTETTSETIEEFDDRAQPSHKSPSPGRDFSTHGFPSVRANKYTQEYPTDRATPPQTPRQPGQDFSTQPQSPRQPSQDFSTHGFPSVRSNKPTQEYPSDRPSSVTEVRRGPDGEEIIVVKSEQSRSVKQKTSSERTVETEYVNDDYPATTQQNLPQKQIAPPRQATPSWEQPASPRRAPVDDYSTHGFPSVRGSRPEHSQPDGEQLISSTSSVSRKSHTERTIETGTETKSPSRSPTRGDYQPSSPRRSQPREDYTTQGFPSARSPTKTTPTTMPDYATPKRAVPQQSRSPPRKPSGASAPTPSSPAAAGSRRINNTNTNESTTTTRRQLQKEREVDAAHRAFAASLRSSSPAESNASNSSQHRRDSGHSTIDHHQRHTPRSSIASSTKTYRRDAREGSHESHAPSEMSRISSTTVTRHPVAPTTKSVGKTLVTKHTVVKTRNVQGSNETIDLMPQRSPKSPSAAKAPVSPLSPASTTKTTNTISTKNTTTIGGGSKPATVSVPAPTPVSVSSPVPAPAPILAPASPSAVSKVPDNQPQYTTTSPADIFSLPPTPPTINNEPTLTTTKYNNNKSNSNSNNTENEITKTKLSTNDATHSSLIEEPMCVKRNYYKLGPSDKEAPNPTFSSAPAKDKAEPAATATAVTGSETVATPKSQPHAPTSDAPNSRHRPSLSPSTNSKRTPTSHRKPYHTTSTTTISTTYDELTVSDNDDDGVPIRKPARRSSKSPSVERRGVVRETTFEKERDSPVRRVSQPDNVARIDDQILVDETNIDVVRKVVSTSPRPRVRSQAPQSPERQLPGQMKPREQSPDKQLPGSSKPKEAPRQSPEKQLPTSTKAKEAPRQSPEKQLPTHSREAPRQSPEKQLPTHSRETPRQSPEKQLPTHSREAPRQSPEKQLPPYSRETPRQSPEKQLPTSPKPKEAPRQSPEKQLPTHSRETPRQSIEKQLPITTKPKEIPRQSTEKLLPTPTNPIEESLFQSTKTQQMSTTTNNLNEEFITNERRTQPTNPKLRDDNDKEPDSPESLDGGFLSKSPESDDSENKPTYRKKGLSRRETFEDRCRKILGMEEDGDTQGDFTPLSDDEQPRVSTSEVTQETCEVKIEDCPYDTDDDKPSRVTKTFMVLNQPFEQHVIKVEQPLPNVQESQRIELMVNVEDSKEIVTTEKSKLINKTQIKSTSKPTKCETKMPVKQLKDDVETINVNEETTIVITKRPSKSPSPQRKEPVSKSPSPQRELLRRGPKSPVRRESLEKHFVAEKVISCNGKSVLEKISKKPRQVSPTAPVKKLLDESEPEELKPKQADTKKPVTTKVDIDQRNSRTSATTRTTTSIKPAQPQKETQPRAQSGKSPRREPVSKLPREPIKRDSLVEESRATISTTSTTTKLGRKPSDTTPTSTTPSIKDRLRSSQRKKKSQPDDVDGQSSSSPEGSPTRFTSERRRSSNISVHTEIIIDHTAPKSPKSDRKPSQTKESARSPTSLRKLPVTERKESAPVPRVTRRDKDMVTRSTSENVIKVVNGKPHKQPEMSTLNPSSAQRTTERGRPSKCFTTKTINLTTTEKLINSEDMESVIIDIQHAKSSREPSPDKIVPTPVPAEMDTGKPRYPDVVQEPEDEPRKKPLITSIPIFEEETSEYVGCHISEVRSLKDHPDNGVDDILDNPTVEVPKSLDYLQPEPEATPVNGDECLLTVHEKVTKFTHTAEQVKQPKSSAPFNREFDRHAKVAANDECLLSINQKVDKFLKTAENVTKQPISPTREIERPNYEHLDEELRQDNCTLSVSEKVHKFIDTAEKLAPTAPQKSPRLVANMERHISRQSEPELEQESEPEGPFESELELETVNKSSEVDDDEEELVPMSKSHTTSIELKRQKDILSRPSVFTQKSVERKSTPIPMPTSSTPRQNGNKPKLPMATTPKAERNRPSATLITEERKSAYKSQQQATTVAKSRFESPREPIREPKRKPSTETPAKQPIGRIQPEISTTDSETELLTSSNRITKYNERITQQQHKLDSDLDVEVDFDEGTPLSPTQFSAKPMAPNRRSTVVKTTTEHSTKHTSTNPLSQPADESEPTVEPLLDEIKPTNAVKTPLHTGVGRTTRVASTTETVASRRNIFEKQSQSPSPSPTPTSKPLESGRRPSYMDHTKSSLEHIRRDSLEINKTNYSRKSSVEDDGVYEPRNPNTAVKFDVPKRSPRKESGASISEELNIDEIFDLLVLEEMLETVTSYELRRRIRAQIRLIKKNMINAGSTVSSTTTTTTTTMRTATKPQPQPLEALPSSGRSPLVTRRTAEQPARDRSHSPDAKTISSSLKEVHSSSRSSKLDKPDSGRPQGKPPLKPRERSCSPVAVTKERPRSPTAGAIQEQQLSRRPSSMRGSASSSPSVQSPERRRSPQSTKLTSRTTSSRTASTMSSSQSPERRGSSKPPVKTEERSSGPIWADRSKVLRGHTAIPASSSPKKVAAQATKAATKVTTRTTTSSSTSSSSSQQQVKHREEDSITSSYGVGPTDENGLPLFGIRALKKKAQPAVEPCAAREEVTGYVIEEQFYSDNKTPARRERKELIYSTNADELAALQQQVERKSSQDESGVVMREFKKIDKQAPPALGYDAADLSELTSDTKYVRRGSVKEMSEKFIRKESSQSITESKTSSNSSSTTTGSGPYLKAGLILRTSSRNSPAQDTAADETEDSESNEVCSVIESAAYTSQRAQPQMEDSGDEAESMQLRQHSTRSTQSTRSFLNTSGEERLVSSVDDVLQRMRNADNVVEPGDSAEDQEARALLNKFLGASVLMQGVESMMPAAVGRSSGGGTTTTTTRTSYAPAGDQAVKTTRVTKTYSKTGSSNNNNSSSSPVTRTTCDIEEICDEDILKQLLEKASTYEERRKIRARLRELMAEREEQKNLKAAAAKEEKEEESSSASEYEEIIEEVTDYSDDEEEEQQQLTTTTTTTATTAKSTEKVEQKATVKSIAQVEKVEKVEKVEQVAKVEKKVSETDGATQVTKKGESLMPLLQDLLHKNPPKNQPKQAQQPEEKAKNKPPPQLQQQKPQTSGKGSGSGSKPPASSSIRNSSKPFSSSNSSDKSSSTAKIAAQPQTKTQTQSQSQSQPKDKPTTTTNPTMTTPTALAKSQAQGQTQTQTQGLAQVNRLSVPQKEDSGTESGEDLRLLAAGLRDTLQMQSESDDTNLIDEVTAALSRLECSLKEGSKELSLDGGRRKALLALVARLQTGLSAPEQLAEVKDFMASDTSKSDNAINAAEDEEEGGYEDASSPEAIEQQRTSRQRFAKRRNRNSRHTVGVSREELADARRYMEDMLMMESISSCTTPDSSTATTPQWTPLEKNASSGAIPTTTAQHSQSQSQPAQLYRPNQFVPKTPKPTTSNNNSNNRRPLSGDYAVSFANYAQETTMANESQNQNQTRFNGSKKQLMKRANTIDIPKAKAKYSADLDTDSELELEGSKTGDGSQLGLKRAVQVSVKRKVQHVVPPFEPKTENDHKFLAFINKQSHQAGLGWGGQRSVSNWTNKFGNIKHTFEVGAAATATTGKPPQVPGHVHGGLGGGAGSAAKQHSWMKQEPVQQTQQLVQQQAVQQARYERERLERQRQEHERQLRLQQQARIEQQQAQFQQQARIEQQQAQLQQHARIEKQARIEQQQAQLQQQSRMEQQARIEQQQAQLQQQVRIEQQQAQLQQQARMEQQARIEQQQAQLQQQVRIEQQQAQLQQQARIEEQARLEREYYERDREQQRQEQEQARLAAAKAAAAAQPPLNQFIHAPQSVFRPIENSQQPATNIYKPIPQKTLPPNTWQPPVARSKPPSIGSPQYLQANNHSQSNNKTPSSSPVGLPWVSKPKVDNSDFKRKAHHFEERSLRDNLEQQPLPPSHSPYLQRHNSLRSKAKPQPLTEFKKRPSLPNAMDPYEASHQAALHQQQLQHQHHHHSQYLPSTQPALRIAPAPPPTNISFSYADYRMPSQQQQASSNYRSYPCLPSAVEYASVEPPRRRRDSLTNPLAEPLVLTSSNPSYCPPQSTSISDQLLLPPPANYASRHFDYASPLDSNHSSPSFVTVPALTDNTDDDLDLDSDNMMEYRAETKVMRKPKSQTAVTVAGRRTAHLSDDEVFGRHSRAAKSLLHTMQQLGPTTNSGERSSKRNGGASGGSSRKPLTAPTSPNLGGGRGGAAGCLSPDGRSYQAPLVEPLFPQLTNFEANRTPLYAAPPSPTATGTPTAVSSMTYQANPSYAPPKPRPDIYAEPPPPPRPFIGETQTSYVVTYPVDDSTDDQDSLYQQSVSQSQRQRQELQRPRRPSEQSNASSTLSLASLTSTHHLPSPSTSWTANPVHVPDQLPTPAAVQRLAKPDLAPKPQLQSQSRSKLTTRSQTIGESSQIYKQPQQQQPEPRMQFQRPQAPMLRQQTLDSSTPMRPLQPQSRVLSQQSLVSRQGNQVQNSFSSQQQQPAPTPAPLPELRRKSLGNMLDSQQQQRKLAYFEQQEQLELDSYKSSAPPDTPDIVKSSLPKDENAPILKKFGPPQRHHYMPNAYQSPQVGGKVASSTTMNSSTTTTTTTTQREIVQHSTLSSKPSVVETPATPQPAAPEDQQDQIPRNIVFNNVSAFTSLSRRHTEEEQHQQQHQGAAPRINRLSKCDSWNQICQQQTVAGQPKYNQPAAGGELRRCKSGHSLAVPKLYEAGIDKAHLGEKQRTVAAYFASQKEEQVTTRKSAINRTRTSEKVSAARKSLGSLGSGASSNAQQQQQSSTTSERTETKSKDGGGMVTTQTTKVTTRTVSGSAAAKNISPLAKFKQLDKQAAQQQAQKSSPTTTTSTPTTPGGSAQPLFKFTDPALNARAATVKDQLLQWCQYKTQEYENVQITNFSSAWSDGLAFCALIHHFLPDAFDYSTLTKQTRRHNFELAFSVADEKAGIAPLLDVEDMVEMSRPDWKCVFVYVQSIYRRFRNCQ